MLYKVWGRLSMLTISLTSNLVTQSVRTHQLTHQPTFSSLQIDTIYDIKVLTLKTSVETVINNLTELGKKCTKKHSSQ